MPRPPETTMRAAVSSGRSLTLISEPSKLEMPTAGAAVTMSIGAAPPSLAAAKAVVRTVPTTILSLVSTVSSALPA